PRGSQLRAPPDARREQPTHDPRWVARTAHDRARVADERLAKIVASGYRLPLARLMRVALVASSFLPEPGRLERRVEQLARGLSQRGAHVEVLTQGSSQPAVEQIERVTIRRFPTVVGPLR